MGEGAIACVSGCVDLKVVRLEADWKGSGFLVVVGVSVVWRS